MLNEQRPGKTVYLEPGDKLVIKFGSVLIANIPTNLQTTEISYETIKEFIWPTKKSRKKSLDSKLSRQILLLLRAAKYGKWTTGAPIDTQEIYNKIGKIVNTFSYEKFQNLTPKAQEAISTAFYLPAHLCRTIQLFLKDEK